MKILEKYYIVEDFIGQEKRELGKGSLKKNKSIIKGFRC